MKSSGSNFLDRIVAERRAAVERARRTQPSDALAAAARCRVHHSLIRSLRSRSPGIIAEVKKASPSAGLLRPRYAPAALAAQYAAAGAAGISVLTEPRHFQGSGAHLRQVRAAVDLPILRKDFIVDPYQIYEAAAWGADAVLLIAAALETGLLRDLHALAARLGLETVVEIHAETELPAALDCPKAIIGVNSRNLKTLKTDLAVARQLGPLIPRDRVAIAESGIRGPDDVRSLAACGFQGFLIGEMFLRHDRPGDRLRDLAAAVGIIR